jgi:signal transduction histidine kinase
VKVTPRITIATGVIVAVVVAAWATFDIRDQEKTRRQSLEREGRTVASALRAGIETGDGGWQGHPADSARDLTRTVTPWRVVLAPMVGGEMPLDDREEKRLQQLADAPKQTIVAYDGGNLVVALPIRRGVPGADANEVIGMLEVVRPTSFLGDATRGDVIEAALLILLVVGLATLAVGYLAQTLMSRPVAKLLSGIDEVAKGDLSHALLSERDDEIGALANRFNEMTYSLRESRAEGHRQTQAKSELEQRLNQTEKLATIGQLAAEIAHEVGTPLGVIGGRARAIQKRSTDKDTVEKNAQIIAEQTARITRIIQRLLDFARRKVGHAQQGVNLNELSLTTMELLGGQFQNAKIKTALARAEGLPKVAGDPDRLQQVLLNLLLNAIQAMPDGGSVRVETTEVTRQRPGLELSPEQAFVRIDVADSGPGIAEDVREKIFEPFFTTKEGKGGTGLGLAVCSGIVKEHDGWIEVDAGAHGGTVFRVFLPVMVVG